MGWPSYCLLGSRLTFTLVSSDCPQDCPFPEGGTSWFESFLMKERSGPEFSSSLRGDGGGSRAVGRSCCLGTVLNECCCPPALWMPICRCMRVAPQTHLQAWCLPAGQECMRADLAVLQVSNCSIVAGEGSSWHVQRHSLNNWNCAGMYIFT